MISIQNLTKQFGRFTAVDAISFSVQPGEIFGFLGANGAGKTTTIRMMCGLLSPTSGQIFFQDEDVTRRPEHIKQNIGYMSQKFSLYGDLSVEANLDFFGAVYGVAKERIQAEKARLRGTFGNDISRGIVSRLPMGFKQRLGLSCSMLHQPPLLFLDEPTSGVDPAGRREFWEDIYDISSQGRTVLVTTHFMDEAEYCDRIAIMSFGRLIDLDTPDAIRSKYREETLNDAFIRAVEEDRARRDQGGEA